MQGSWWVLYKYSSPYKHGVDDYVLENAKKNNPEESRFPSRKIVGLMVETSHPHVMELQAKARILTAYLDP